MNALAAIAIPIPSWHIIHHGSHTICVNAQIATITDYDLVVVFFYVAPALFLMRVLLKVKDKVFPENGRKEDQS